MKLLIVTQTVDTQDPVLGFFVQWIEEFAKHVEICLKKGKYELPKNVTVHSLGKENAHNTAPSGARRCITRPLYAFRFLSLAWRLRDNYDTVFVHMNQEYVLVAGLLWKIFGKNIYLWRNHYSGSFITDIVAIFCTKIFCTSKYSYTIKYKKTMLMPVGVDTNRFSLDKGSVRTPNSILSLGRIAPVKRIEVLIDALAMLAHDNIDFSATIVGSPLPKDKAYYDSLKNKVRKFGIESRVTFLQSLPNKETPTLYRTHEIFVNTTPPGAFDKTLFEAAACGCVVLAASKDFAELVGTGTFFDSNTSLKKILKYFLSAQNKSDKVHIFDNLVKEQSLAILSALLIKEIDKV